MGVNFDKVKFWEERVAMKRGTISLLYNAHRDAVDELFEDERQLRIARRG